MIVSGYPGLEIIAKLATVLECEPAELLRVPGAGRRLATTPHKDRVDPSAWAIVEGKLYLTHTTRSLAAWQQESGRKHQNGGPELADRRDQAEPAVVGPPCRDRPPSVVISFKDGGRRLLVGGQVEVDGNGNVVGKGDMRAQMSRSARIFKPASLPPELRRPTSS
jgi:hypothetical protein